MLRKLADGACQLSTALRESLLLPEVEADGELRGWISTELTGYHDESTPVRDYRRHTLSIRGNASNRAYRVSNASLPTAGLPDQLKDYATCPHEFSESIEELESLLASGEPEFNLPWDPNAVARLNSAVAAGGTAINGTYRFSEVWWQVPAPTITGILARIRHEALSRIAALVPVDQRFSAADPTSMERDAPSVMVSGTGHQVMVGSPGSHQAMPIPQGDWAALDRALLEYGIPADQVDDLRRTLDDPTSSEESKVHRAVVWARQAAAHLGLSTAGSAIAALLLQYLGQL